MDLPKLKENLKATYLKRLNELKPVLRHYLEEAICGDYLPVPLIKEYAENLMYYEFLKNENNRELPPYLLPIINRFVNRKTAGPSSVELAFIVYQLLNYNYENGTFFDKPDSPNDNHHRMYM